MSLALFLMVVLTTICVREAIANQCVKIPSSSVNDQRRAQKNWAIVALGRPGRADIDTRNKNLATKLRPYAKLHNITVIVFSEKEFTTATITKWKEVFRDVASVRYINTYKNGFAGKEQFGYKYMCKFFAMDIYDYLKDDYDYYMRCDTDCYLNKLDYDVMKWAEDNSVEYGFAMRKLEAHKPTRETLPAFSEKYMANCQIKAKAIMDQPFSTCFNFYNNWHIGKVSFFTRPDVQHYLKAVNSSGFILSHRWGDSTIQAYAVRIFMKPENIVQIPNFMYTHASHGNSIVSTFGDGSATTVPQRLPNWAAAQKSQSEAPQNTVAAVVK